MEQERSQMHPPSCQMTTPTLFSQYGSAWKKRRVRIMSEWCLMAATWRGVDPTWRRRGGGTFLRVHLCLHRLQVCSNREWLGYRVQFLAYSHIHIIEPSIHHYLLLTHVVLGVNVSPILEKPLSCIVPPNEGQNMEDTAS